MISIIVWQVKKAYSASPAGVSTRREVVDVRVAFCGEDISISAILCTRSSVDVFSFAQLIITLILSRLLNIKGGNKPINSRFYPSWKIRMEQFYRSYYTQLSFEAAPDDTELFSLFSPEAFLRLLRLRFFFEFFSPTAAS